MLYITSLSEHFSITSWYIGAYTNSIFVPLVDNWVRNFLNSNISIENKEKVIEQLYLFQLYINAYIGPDPRVKEKLFHKVIGVLNVKEDDEIIDSIKELQEVVEFMKDIEVHPIDTAKRRLEEEEAYKNTMF